MEHRIEHIEKQLEKIMDNELVHVKENIDVLHETVSSVNTKVERIAVDVDWIKKFFWLVTTTSFGSLIAAVVGIILNQ